MTTRRMEPPLQERELTPDERAVLGVYAAAESPLASFEVAEVLNPRPARMDGRTYARTQSVGGPTERPHAHPNGPVPPGLPLPLRRDGRLRDPEPPVHHRRRKGESSVTDNYPPVLDEVSRRRTERDTAEARIGRDEVDSLNQLYADDMTKCVATYGLDDDDIVTILRMAWAVTDNPDLFSFRHTATCDMPAAHKGPHAADLVGNTNDSIWVLWDDDGKRIEDLASCPLPRGEDPSCTLYEGHEGPHPIYF